MKDKKKTVEHFDLFLSYKTERKKTIKEISIMNQLFKQ